MEIEDGNFERSVASSWASLSLPTMMKKVQNSGSLRRKRGRKQGSNTDKVNTKSGFVAWKKFLQSKANTKSGLSKFQAEE